MTAPELTYADVMILILWLILSFLLVWLISIVSINFKMPKWDRRIFKRRTKPSKEAIITQLRSELIAEKEQCALYRQSNSVLRKENQRLRMLLNGVE